MSILIDPAVMEAIEAALRGDAPPVIEPDIEPAEQDDDTPIEAPSDMTVWGFIENGSFVRLPKTPMTHLGPPPFDVTLPSGEVRHIILEPYHVEP